MIIKIIVFKKKAISATQQAEIWRIVLQGQPGEIICKTSLISKNTEAKMDRRFYSSSRIPDLQARSPTSNSSPTKKEKSRYSGTCL
jgi:hypothetical protein